MNRLQRNLLLPTLEVWRENKAQDPWRLLQERTVLVADTTLVLTPEEEELLRRVYEECQRNIERTDRAFTALCEDAVLVLDGKLQTIK